MEDGKYIPLEELDIYQLAMEIGELVWNWVIAWDSFSKFHLGGQFTDAADSIAANISEGYGRFHFKDKRNFYYNARGSLSETKIWATKSRQRNLLSNENYDLLYSKLQELHRRLNQHIKSLPIN
ncbi:MAG: four helix bundle protein [Saprospiraceae bacterium]